MKTVLYGLVLSLVGLVSSSPVLADENSTGYLDGSTRKLGRGICNLATAPLELLRTPYLITQQEGELAGATVGVVQGVGAVIIRELAGALEVLTFFVPFPNGFTPILTPEFVYADGDWVP